MLLCLGLAAAAFVVFVVVRTIGKVLAAVLEIAAVLFLLYKAVKAIASAIIWILEQVRRFWRTTLAALMVAFLVSVVGWVALLVALLVFALTFVVWWHEHVVSFDRFVGRHLRAWWLRWTVYQPRWKLWMHSCGLAVFSGGRDAVELGMPTIKAVRSGASWDEVVVRLVPV